MLITENLVDEDFVNKYALGYDFSTCPKALRMLNCSRPYNLGESDGVPKTPQWAEEYTAVPADTIARIAREYGNTKPAMLYQGYGMQRRAYGEQVVRMGCVLPVLTGNVGVPGEGFRRRLRHLRRIQPRRGLPVRRQPDPLLHPVLPLHRSGAARQRNRNPLTAYAVWLKAKRRCPTTSSSSTTAQATA